MIFEKFEKDTVYRVTSKKYPNDTHIVVYKGLVKDVYPDLNYNRGYYNRHYFRVVLTNGGANGYMLTDEGYDDYVFEKL